VRALRAACAAAVVLSTWWMAGGRGSASDLTQVSWWWRGNTGPAPLPSPAPVPPGGILVAGAPDGATAIAAVSFTLAEGESNPALTLTVADNGDQGGAQAVMAACLAGSAWAGSEQGGPWESKPNAACANGSIQGVRAADGKTWTFALAPLVVAREVNVVITPGTVAPGAPVGSTFSVAFTAPTSASLATTRGSSGTSSDAAGSAVPADAVSPETGGADSTVADTGTAALDLSSAGGASAFQPSLPASSQGLTATAPLTRQATAANVTPVTEPTNGNAPAAVVVVLACVAVAVRLNRIPVPRPRLLGPLASAASRLAPAAVAPQPGGLGRFSRLRTGAPPPLV
jgi:hypothetical protein